MNFILGSQSPRRKEILSFFDLPFKQVKPHFDEESMPFTGGNPGHYATLLACEKGKSLLKEHPEAYILTADTVVYHNGRSFGKAANYDEAFEMLSTLSGTQHAVYTGMSLISPKGHFKGHGETLVTFNRLTPEEIDLYLRNAHWQDKAGSYAIQGPGSLTIKEIKGCYYNVMGLPVNTLKSLLEQAGISLWDHLRKQNCCPTVY